MALCASLRVARGILLFHPGVVCLAAVLRGVVDSDPDRSDVPESWRNVAEVASTSAEDAGADKLVSFYRSLNASRGIHDPDVDVFGITSGGGSAAAEEEAGSSESVLDSAHVLASTSAASASDSPASIQSVAGNDRSLPLLKTSQGWYAIEVEMGGTPVRLAVDTGSSYLWHRPPAANASRSQPSSDDAPIQHFSAQYGRGAVSGDIYDETVVFGGQPLSCAVGSATDLSAFWARQKTVDGVLGLGCSSLAPAGALDCAWPWDRKVFTLSMDQDGGELFLGSVPSQYQSSLVYLPPGDDCSHWTAPLLSLTVFKAGEMPQNVLAGTHTAILDSGSDGLVGPARQVEELAARMGGASEKTGEGYDASVRFFTAPCDQVLADIEVTLGTADGSESNGASVRISGEYLMSAEARNSGQARCRLRLVGWEKTQEWILGRVFLTRIQAAVFDIDAQRVGLAL